MQQLSVQEQAPRAAYMPSSGLVSQCRLRLYQGASPDGTLELQRAVALSKALIWMRITPGVFRRSQALISGSLRKA